jgi:catalase
MSVRLQGGGETWDLVMESEPVFFAATPASFVSFLAARMPDPATGEADPRKIAAHNAAHPDGVLQPALLAGHAAPASVATAAFYSTHAFVFADAAGRSQAARLVAEPAAGVVYLSDREEKEMPDQFLGAELVRRLQEAPVIYTLFAQLPAPGDPLDDPSRLWKGENKVALGRLTVTAPAGGESCDPLVFIPLRLPRGIAPTDDPVLKARAEPYALSRARRTN